jgi:RHS repeat-associated protein
VNPLDVAVWSGACPPAAGMSDGSGTVTSVFDGLNRLTGTSRGGDSFGYGYDLAGNVVRRGYPDGTAIDFGFDEDERLASVTSAGGTTGYAYDAAGHLTETTLPAANGYSETRGYDRAGRLVELDNRTAATTLSGFVSTLDPVGNPVEVVRTGDLGGTETFGYDAGDRLVSVCYQAGGCPGGGDPFVRWSYDRVGNRLSETRPAGTTSYSYDALDELTQAGATGYGYDADGNQVSAGAVGFGYDLAGRLTSSTSGGSTTSYRYDGDGNRLQASSGGLAAQTTNYLWDTNQALPQLALERDGDDTLLRRYSYGVRRISISTPGGGFYYHYDPLGSVADLTSATGTSEWSESYEPFGGSRSETQDDPTAPANPFKYAGEYADPGGLYDLRARQYDPATGSFLSRDPAAAAAGSPSTSAYAYAGDQPTVMIDPSGRTFQPSNAGQQSALAAASPSGGAVGRGSIRKLAAEEPTAGALGCCATNAGAPGSTAGLAAGGGTGTAAEEGSGIVASDGTRISGFTGHGVDRAIGDGAKRAGVKPQALRDAIRNPTKITEGVDDLGRPYKIYTGGDARVVVNPQTGRVVSVNPLSRAGANR